MVKNMLCLFMIYRCVDIFHICRKPLHLLPHNVATRIADLVNSAYLSGRFREFTLDSLGKSIQIIGHRDQSILHTTSLQICEYWHPQSRTFTLAVMPTFEPPNFHILKSSFFCCNKIRVSFEYALKIYSLWLIALYKST